MPVVDLPRSLERYRRQLELAVADDLARRRRRRLRLGAVAVVLAAIVVVLNVLPGGAADRPLPAVEPASAVERAAAALQRDRTTILHMHMVARQYEDGRPDIQWENEAWIGSGGQRMIERAPDGRVVETEHVGGWDRLWDGRRVLETRSPEPESSYSPDEKFRDEALQSLRDGHARVARRLRRGGRDALKIVSDGGSATFIVDAHDYTPIEFRTRGTGGGTVLRFVAYERFPVSAETRRLLSIAAQHDGAPVVRDAAAYQAAMEKLFPYG
jgi:hypothetical protein